jgi:gluconolactonase
MVAAFVLAGACGGKAEVDARGDGAAGTGAGGAGAGGTAGGDAAADAKPEVGPEVGDVGPKTDASSADGGDAGGAPTSTLGAVHCPPASGAYPNPLANSVTPAQVPITPPGGIMFLEGPVWLADRGVLLLSEWNGGHRILQLTPPAAVEVFLPASRTNGLALAPESGALLIITESPGAGVARLNLADKSVTPLVQAYEGQPFVQPNDLAVRADGTIYFTDYQAGRLYRRAPDGGLTIVSSLAKSNGVALSPDERTLYLNADTRTVKYPVAADGTVGAGTDLTTGLRGADGLAIDCAGNVYVAQNDGGAVAVVSAAGTKLGEIGGLPRAVTNAAFGGPTKRTLYITTSSALYAAELPVPGLPY